MDRLVCILVIHIVFLVILTWDMGLVRISGTYILGMFNQRKCMEMLTTAITMHIKLMEITMGMVKLQLTHLPIQRVMLLL